jgi:hypothetical protein
MILSTDGYAKWAWSSEPAFRSGRYIKTSASPPYEMPAESGIARGVSAKELKDGIDHPAGVWFEEPVRELSFHSASQNCRFTLLHLKNADLGAWHAEQRTEDTTIASCVGDEQL